MQRRWLLASFAFPLLACGSPRKDLDKLCRLADEVVAEGVSDDRAMDEISTRFAPKSAEIRDAYGLVFVVAPHQQWTVLRNIAATAGYEDYQCPTLEKLLASQPPPPGSIAAEQQTATPE